MATLSLSDLPELTHALGQLPLGRSYGRVVAATGMVVRVEGLTHAPLGTRCMIHDVHGVQGMTTTPAEIIGHEQVNTPDGGGTQALLMPFGGLEGISPGARVYPERGVPAVRVNHSWIGRVVNALGEPLDAAGPLAGVGGEIKPLRAGPPPAGQRQALGPRLDVGVKVLNTILPLCAGQRLGIFSGSGVGKSVLMGMLAKFSKADVIVVGLIGERGKEVREFVHEQLGPAGLARSVVVVATGDEPPLMRRQAAYLTLTVAEYFRDCGFNVLCMMDSVTRFALAQREIGLASGEPPTTRGFTPSVFAELPKLLERAGPGVGKGTISGIFTVLVEGSDLEEPIADAVRGILDGHVVLTRQLAERGHFPAVDVLKSVSRTVPQCLAGDEPGVVQRTRSLLATYTDMEELIRLGAYTAGADPAVDEALRVMPGLQSFLRQAPDEQVDAASAWAALRAAVG